jgi:hypothetical protein
LLRKKGPRGRRASMPTAIPYPAKNARLGRMASLYRAASVRLGRTVSRFRARRALMQTEIRFRAGSVL